MEIETARLRLREYVEEDWAAVLAWQSKPEYGTYYEDKPRTEASSREFVGWFLGWQQELPRRRFQLAMTLREDGRLIGGCGIRVRRLVDFGAADTLIEADIGYELDPAFWRQGLATEAVGALVDWGFRELGLHRVWAYCLVENERSWHLMQRLGFQREGHLRENEWMRGRWWDTYVYGQLASEWQSPHS